MEAPKAPVWSEVADQPVVEWPAALLPPMTNPEHASLQPAERVLPTETETTISALAEPYRDPRKPPPAFWAKADDKPIAKPEPVGHVAESEQPPVKPAERILPMIEHPLPIKVKSAAEDVTAVATPVRPRRAKPVQTAEPAADPPLMVLPSEIDAAAVAATFVLRQSEERLTRDDFKRGERWKARLPAAVHRAKRR